MTKDYEDNTTFFSNRYDATKKSVSNLIALYNKSNNEFNLGTIISGFGFSMKLNNFQAYADSAGCNRDLYNYSTSVFRVNQSKGEKLKENEEDCVDYEPYVHYFLP